MKARDVSWFAFCGAVLPVFWMEVPEWYSNAVIFMLWFTAAVMILAFLLGTTEDLVKKHKEKNPTWISKLKIAADLAIALSAAASGRYALASFWMVLTFLVIGLLLQKQPEKTDT